MRTAMTLASGSPARTRSLRPGAAPGSPKRLGRPTAVSSASSSPERRAAGVSSEKPRSASELRALWHIAQFAYK